MLRALVLDLFTRDSVQFLAHRVKSELLKLSLFLTEEGAFVRALVWRNEKGRLLEDCTAARQHHDLVRDAFPYLALLQEGQDPLIQALETMLHDFKLTLLNESDMRHRVSFTQDDLADFFCPNFLKSVVHLDYRLR